MARGKRRKRKPVETPRLTNEVIDHYLARAAETVKEVERDLQSTFKLPASSLLLRIQTRRA
jgi:hypothetical protein